MISKRVIYFLISAYAVNRAMCVKRLLLRVHFYHYSLIILLIFNHELEDVDNVEYPIYVFFTRCTQCSSPTTQRSRGAVIADSTTLAHQGTGAQP